MTAVTISDDSEHGPVKGGVPDYNVMAPKLTRSMELSSWWRPSQRLFTNKQLEFGFALAGKGVIAMCIKRTLRKSWPLRPAVKEV